MHQAGGARKGKTEFRRSRYNSVMGREGRDAIGGDVMDNSKRYVRLDEHGVWRVGNSHVMLDGVVAGFHQGQSPETIRQSYSALSLEAVYGAIADYLANKAEFDEYVRRQDELWERERARAEAHRPPVVERLRKLQRETAPRRG